MASTLFISALLCLPVGIFVAMGVSLLRKRPVPEWVGDAVFFSSIAWLLLFVGSLIAVTH